MEKNSNYATKAINLYETNVRIGLYLGTKKRQFNTIDSNFNPMNTAIFKLEKQTCAVIHLEKPTVLIKHHKSTVKK